MQDLVMVRSRFICDCTAKQPQALNCAATGKWVTEAKRCAKVTSYCNYLSRVFIVLQPFLWCCNCTNSWTLRRAQGSVCYSARTVAFPSLDHDGTAGGNHEFALHLLLSLKHSNIKSGFDSEVPLLENDPSFCPPLACKLSVRVRPPSHCLAYSVGLFNPAPPSLILSQFCVGQNFLFFYFRNWPEGGQAHRATDHCQARSQPARTDHVQLKSHPLPAMKSIKTTWKDIPPVPTSQEFLDIVLSRTQRRLPTQIRAGFKISRIRGGFPLKS